MVRMGRRDVCAAFVSLLSLSGLARQPGRDPTTRQLEQLADS